MKQFCLSLTRLFIRAVIFMILIFMNADLYSQCSGGTSGGALSPVPSSSYQTMSVISGRYYTFVVAAGCLPTYDFSFCATEGGSSTFSDSQITILDNSGAYAGGYNDDFCSYLSHVTWTPTAAGTYRVLINNYPCSSSGASATLAYKITTPANMTYTSATVTQTSTATVTKCDVNQAIIGVQIVTGGGACNVLSLTQLQITMAGTSPTTDVSLIHVYYTGTTSTFSAVNAFDGAGTSVSAGTITINGSQTLSVGTNYFWVAYDINSSATTGNVIDAACLAGNTLTVGGTARTVTTNNPAGTRTITTCPLSPGSVSSGLTLWLKAGAGVTAAGANVTGWTDQSTAATAITVNGSPDRITSGYNFNPYISFTMSSATGGDYLHTPDINLRSFFWVAQLTNLTRKSTHLATYDGVTLSAPCALCPIHGGENGSTVAEYGEWSYGGSNFQSAGVWRKNGDPSGVAYNTAHSGNFDIITALGGGAVPTNVFMGGQNSNGATFDGRVRDWVGPVGEIIAYSGSVTTSQANKIESYLAIKYGITLGGNGSTTLAYTSPAGTTLWPANTGYHYDVIGIGKDLVTEGLSQPKSKSINTPSDVITIANSNFTTPVALTNDGDYLLTGHNNGSLAVPVTATFTHNGPATVMGVQLSRVWRSHKTGTPAGNVIIEFNMALINGPAGYGTNTNADIRLMVDDDANFSNASAGEHTYTPVAGYAATGGNIYFTVPYSDLQNGTGYFTIASVNVATAPLPIDLVEFSAKCDHDKVDLKWITATEINNDFFTIDRTTDGILFEQIAVVDGAGNSSGTISYQWTDDQPVEGVSYYRLKQTDFDGSTKTFGSIEADCDQMVNELEIDNVFQSGDQLYLDFTTSYEAEHCIKIYDATGKMIFLETKFLSMGHNSCLVNLDGLSGGIYFINIYNSEKQKSKKVLIK
jgi:hypothetical protein